MSKYTTFYYHEGDEPDAEAPTAIVPARFSGHAFTPAFYRHNGQRRFNTRECTNPETELEVTMEEPDEQPERSIMPNLRRLVAAEISRYRTGGLLSPKELKTVEALWAGGLTLREFARREGVAPQAIEDRIQRVRERAPRFWIWWRRKNRMRGRR